jgi:hypothetical protein
LPPTLAEYELQVDDALRALATSSKDFIPKPDFQTVSNAYNTKKPVNVLALEIMEAAQHNSPKKKSPQKEGGEFLI